MPVLRWIAKSGFRVSMILTVLVLAYHVLAEIRALDGRPLDFFQRLELTALDAQFTARGARPPKRWSVAIAAADEKAIKALGRLPWSRAVHAHLTDALTELGAKVIAFDMTFADASGEGAAIRALAEEGKSSGLFAAPARLEESRRAAEKAELALAKGPKELRSLAPPMKAAAENIGATARAIQQHAAELLGEAGRSNADRIFAEALSRSGRVVLGMVAYSKLEAASESAEDFKGAMRLAASSTISEIQWAGADGLTHLQAGGRSFEEDYRTFFGLQAPVPALARATAHLGLINAFPDADGVYRRVNMVDGVKGSGVLLPALAVEAVSAALGRPIEIHAAPGAAGPDAIAIGPHLIETGLGAAAMLDYYGPFDPDAMPIFSIADVLDKKLAPNDLKDRIVFVAATAIGTFDQRVTPFDSAVPGVHIHATLAQNILDDRHLSRPFLSILIELFVLLSIGLVSGLVLARLGALGQGLGAVALAVGWVLFDRFVLFERGLVVYSVLPVAHTFVTLLAIVSWRFLTEEREKRKIRHAFGRYLAPAVMEQVLAHPEEYLRLGGKRYEATVLFSDIRGFTTISEALSPEVLGNLLNRYMTPMTDIVFRHGGTLDKYIGDAVMAFWGAPIPQPDHAARACRAALEMVEKVKDLNVEFAAAGLPRIAIGIGLSTGPMTIGNMGSTDHLAYTALGDRVNLGSRLEGQTKEYGVDIIISDACHAAVKDVMACRELGALRVKGKLEPVRIFQLIKEGRLTGDPAAFVETFHRGLERFRGRAFAEAVTLFGQALELAGPSGDKSSEEYLSLSEEYQESPPPEGWDGVRIATSK
jgi:adenylate cyclase